MSIAGAMVVLLAWRAACAGAAGVETASHFSVCDAMYNNTSKVQCYCSHTQDAVLNAECSLTTTDTTLTDADWNSFEDIATVKKLIFSDIRGVSLDYIPTRALRYTISLENLVIKHGNITTIVKHAFGNSTSLEEISIRENQVKILEPMSFSHMPELAVINLEGNDITELNRFVLVQLPSLKKLYLTNNKLSIIHDNAFIHVSSLVELELDDNNLISLNSETFTGLSNLEVLDISSNALEVIGDRTFNPLTKLISLNLEGNKIQLLDGGAFRGLEKLKSLSLAHNKLTNIEDPYTLEPLESIISVSLRGNQLIELKEEVIAPIMINLYSNVGILDVEDNPFPCDCRLDWFMTLMNRTLNTQLKLHIENMKCVPSQTLKDLWAEAAVIEKSSERALEEDQIQNNDYEYYDDSQLNGKLFYVDLRDDFLKCNKMIYTEETLEEVVTPKPKPNMKPGVSRFATVLTKPRPEMFEKKGIEKNQKFMTHATTVHGATVTNKPMQRNYVLQEQVMVSDQTNTDRVTKSHRSGIATGDPYAGNHSNLTSACATMLLSIIITFKFLG